MNDPVVVGEEKACVTEVQIHLFISPTTYNIPTVHARDNEFSYPRTLSPFTTLTGKYEHRDLSSFVR